MGDGTVKGAIEYLDNLIEKGKATGGAIKPLKIAITKVVQMVDGEAWETTVVRSIDVDDYMTRFGNLTLGKYSSDSLTTYKSRVNKVVAWYTQFLDKPGWTPDVQARTRTSKPAAAKPKTSVDAQPAAQAPAVAVESPDRVTYPYPLSDGQLVHISLPIKLSKADAKRIAGFIESIAIDAPAEA